MRAPSRLFPVCLALLLAAGACRARLPVDRPGMGAPSTLPASPAVARAPRRVEYFQISDG